MKQEAGVQAADQQSAGEVNHSGDLEVNLVSLPNIAAML